MDINALAASPISESSPVGAEAKYEPEYEALTAEIAKLSSVSQSSPISWEAVADNAAEILAHKSKDFQVASYMAVALQQTGGAQGFVDGAMLLRGLCENFWDDAFPPKNKIRRRLNAYEWWHERALDLLKREGQPPIAAELSSSMTKAADELDRLIGGLMDDALPLHDIKEAIRAIPLIPEEKPQEQPAPQPQAVEPEAEQSAPEPEPPSPQPVQAAPEPPRPAATAQPGDIAGAQSAFVEAARSYAFALRADDPANYLAWQLPRVALWSRVAALPPADASGQTMIPAPDFDRIEAVERLLSGRNWLKAALAADDLFPSYPLCIDLQRMADEALGGLGAAFAAARERVRSETAAFVSRLPGIVSLSYDGGAPFVSPAARAWLEEISQKASGGGQVGGAGGCDKTSAAVAEARELLSGGDAAGALKRLEEAQGASVTANLRLRSEALHILCAQREAKAAAALARALMAELERDCVPKLEPDAAVEAMSAACRALELAGDSEAAEQTRAKLAALRPSAVLGWS